MDPQACLLAAESRIAEGESESAADALENYREWRQRGGFEPTMPGYLETLGGDKFYAQLVARFRERFHAEPF